MFRHYGRAYGGRRRKTLATPATDMGAVARWFGRGIFIAENVVATKMSTKPLLAYYKPHEHVSQKQNTSLALPDYLFDLQETQPN